jgi:calcium-dependent protein kinase
VCSGTKKGDSKKACAVIRIKAIPFQRLEKDRQAWENELDIGRRLKHPNIIRLYDAVVDEVDEAWYLVMEFCGGGSLFDWIERNEFALVPGSIIAQLGVEMLSGIKYIHHHKFCHRDIKPDNYMLPSKDDGAPLKLIDFGLATKFEQGVPIKERCGTVEYSAPEVIRRNYTEKCDIWSIGVTFYMVCVGCWPFYLAHEEQLVELIKMGPDVFGPKNAAKTEKFYQLGKHKTPVMALVKELLEPDAIKRSSAREVLKTNKWLQETSNSNATGCCAVL